MITSLRHIHQKGTESALLKHKIIYSLIHLFVTIIEIDSSCSVYLNLWSQWKHRRHTVLVKTLIRLFFNRFISSPFCKAKISNCDMGNVNITILCQFLVRNYSSTKVVVNVEKQVVFGRPVSATPNQKGIFFVWKGKQIFLYIAHVHLYYGTTGCVDVCVLCQKSLEC